MNASRSSTRRLPSRSGLAPLELVLALPLMLSVMALIVNFAHASIWKTRSATGARLAMWRDRPMWDAGRDPKPVNYARPDTLLNVYSDARVAEVDGYWNQPAITQLWIKGPIYTVPNGYLRVRDNRVNEMSEGVSKGQASVRTNYPFLPSTGKVDLRVTHALLDSAWQYHTMGYAYNDRRRAKGWWELDDSPDWAGLKQAFLDADSQMVNNSQRERLRPLDRDEDLYREQRFGYDFYPPTGGCYEERDPQLVQMRFAAPGGLLEQITGNLSSGTRGVCQNMATAYLNMYESELADLMMMEKPSAAGIAQLELWIAQLKDFLAQLP